MAYTGSGFIHSLKMDTKKAAQSSSKARLEGDLTFTPHSDYLVIDATGYHKPSIWEKILSFLRRLLEQILKCLTSGCCDGNGDDDSSGSSSRELTEEESATLARYMAMLETEESSSTPTMTREHHKCLVILARSGFESLHKLAASSYLIFALNTSHVYEPWEMEPLLYLLRAGTAPVKLQSAEALFHIVHNGNSDNKPLFVSMGCIQRLVNGLSSADVNLQVLLLATLTSLMSKTSAQEAFHNRDAVNTVLKLSQSKNKHVRMGALGVILNYTRNDCSPEHLSTRQAIDALGEALASDDPTSLAHASAVLCNLAIGPTFRTLVAQQSRSTVVKNLIKLMTYHEDKVRLNACSALRNLACASEIQLLLVQLDALPVVKTVLSEAAGELLVTTLSLLKNIALHKSIESKIVEESFLQQLERIVRMQDLPEAQEMAAMVLRNVACQDTMEKILTAKCLEAFLDVLVDDRTTEDVLLAVAIALGVLTDHVIARQSVVNYQDGVALTRLVQLAAKHNNISVRESSAGVLAHVSTIVIPTPLLSVNIPNLLLYFQRALSSNSVELLHIALWTLPKFLAHESFRRAFNERRLGEIVELQVDFGVTENIQSLARLAQEMSGQLPSTSK